MSGERPIDYAYGDTHFTGQLFAEGIGRPGVVLFAAGRGIDEQARIRAQTLADTGFTVLVADYHGGPQPIATVEEAIAQAKMLRSDPALMRGRARAALAELCRQPEVDPSRLAAVGFCLGGTIALELARSGADIAAAAVFHGELASLEPAGPGTIKARLLVLTGSLDPTVPPEQIANFLAEADHAGIDAEVRSYSGTRHAFTNPAAGGHPAMAHHPESDRRAWSALVPFLNQAFGDRDGDQARAA